MYEEHFGLKARPFGSPLAYLPLPSREAVGRRLRYALEEAQGPAMLHGEPGVGKTSLVRELAARTGRQAVHLTFPALGPTDLLAFLAEEWNCPPDTAPGAAGDVRRIRAHLRAQGAPLLLIVDEAHLLTDPSSFESLRLLLNFESSGGPCLALLLVGGPELPLLLPDSLCDRMAARCVLRPLEEAESAAYIIGRMASAGGSVTTFAPGALRRLFVESDGFPRRLNRLADLGLLLAYADGRNGVTEEDIVGAAREFGPRKVA